METKRNIIDYLPQRYPFILVDEILYTDSETTKTSFTVSAGHVLLEGNTLTEAGIVENMAQTAAAGEGKKAELANITLNGGYLVSINNLKISTLPAINDRLITEIKFIQSILNYRIIKARVLLSEREIAIAELKILVI